jgi:SAM-dependent methyltransferase
MDLTDYRNSAPEQQRTADLVSLLPRFAASALDVGARDGYFSRVLATHYESVTALDLERPQIAHARIRCVAGNVTHLPFDDDAFDLVVCTEVLEHIAPDRLACATDELARVARHHLLIGVPYREDTRIGRTRCPVCGSRNPPWGHVNVFDEDRLLRLFAGWLVERRSFVGHRKETTNSVAAYLMDLAGNLYGTYGQEEPCVHCGAPLTTPPPRTPGRRVITKLGVWSARTTQPFRRPGPQWIHVLLCKR